jgi:hypothetical protein
MINIHDKTLEEKWNRSFPKKNKSNILLLLVVWDNYLGEKGDIKRIIKLRIRALDNGVDNYIWRIPHLGNNSYPVGIRVSQGGYLLPFRKVIINNDGNLLTEVNISFQPLRADDEISFTIEYYEHGYIKLVRKHLFSTQWKYSWAYKFLNKTNYFETRVYLPKTAINIDNQEPPKDPQNKNTIKINDRLVYLLEIENPQLGNITGSVTFSLPSSATSTTISLIAGFLVAIPITIITNLVWYVVLIILIFVFVVIFFSHRLIEKWQ